MCVCASTSPPLSLSLLNSETQARAINLPAHPASHNNLHFTFTSASPSITDQVAAARDPCFASLRCDTTPPFTGEYRPSAEREHARYGGGQCGGHRDRRRRRGLAAPTPVAGGGREARVARRPATQHVWGPG